MQIKQKEIIKFAEEAGLLLKDSNFPYSCPAHQRMISKLQKLAEKILESKYEKS